MTNPPVTCDVAESSSRVFCLVCEATIHHNSCTINCFGCSRSAHMSWVVSQYKHTGAMQPKITYEWLFGFIQHVGLHHVCQHCGRIGFPHVSANAGNSTGEFTTQDLRIDLVYHQNASNNIVNIKMPVLDLASKLNIMATNIDSFRHEISKKLLDSSSNAGTILVSTSAT